MKRDKFWKERKKVEKIAIHWKTALNTKVDHNQHNHLHSARCSHTHNHMKLNVGMNRERVDCGDGDIWIGLHLCIVRCPMYEWYSYVLHCHRKFHSEMHFYATATKCMWTHEYDKDDSTLIPSVLPKHSQNSFDQLMCGDCTMHRHTHVKVNRLHVRMEKSWKASSSSSAATAACTCEPARPNAHILEL